MSVRIGRRHVEVFAVGRKTRHPFVIPRPRVTQHFCPRFVIHAIPDFFVKRLESVATRYPFDLRPWVFWTNPVLLLKAVKVPLPPFGKLPKPVMVDMREVALHVVILRRAFFDALHVKRDPFQVLTVKSRHLGFGDSCCCCVDAPAHLG